MPNTALNVLGNTLAPIVIAKWENKFSDKRYAETVKQL